jgi:hypothetical protein
MLWTSDPQQFRAHFFVPSKEGFKKSGIVAEIIRKDYDSRPASQLRL